MPTYKEKLHGYVEKIKGLDDEEKIDRILDLITGDANAQSKFLSSPIQVNETKVFPIPNYGSGMSPFFSALSMWIGQCYYCHCLLHMLKILRMEHD